MASDLTLNDAVARDIRKAARSVAYHWPGVIEACDVEQSIWLRLLESPGTYDFVSGLDAGPRYRTIAKLGHQIASKERTDYDHFTGDFRYSVGEVKALLDSGTLLDLEPLIGSTYSAEEFTAKGGSPEDAVLSKVSSETDLRRSLDRLHTTTPQYVDIVYRRYLHGESLEDSNDRKRLSRALTALTDGMNRSFKQRHVARPDGPGTRRCVSRSTAYSIVRTQDSGDYYEKSI